MAERVFLCGQKSKNHSSSARFFNLNLTQYEDHPNNISLGNIRYLYAPFIRGWRINEKANPVAR